MPPGYKCLDVNRSGDFEWLAVSGFTSLCSRWFWQRYSRFPQQRPPHTPTPTALPVITARSVQCPPRTSVLVQSTTTRHARSATTTPSPAPIPITTRPPTAVRRAIRAGEHRWSRRSPTMWTPVATARSPLPIRRIPIRPYFTSSTPSPAGWSPRSSRSPSAVHAMRSRRATRVMTTPPCRTPRLTRTTSRM